MKFKIKSEFSPTGDQPQAINQLVESLNTNEKIPDFAWRYGFR
jgi:excinuclease ABC subunit B